MNKAAQITRQKSYRLPPEVIRSVERQAKSERRWPAQVVADACRKYLEATRTKEARSA